jgi:hypothetical protein
MDPTGKLVMEAVLETKAANKPVRSAKRGRINALDDVAPTG